VRVGCIDCVSSVGCSGMVIVRCVDCVSSVGCVSCSAMLMVDVGVMDEGLSCGGKSKGLSCLRWVRDDQKEER